MIARVDRLLLGATYEEPLRDVGEGRVGPVASPPDLPPGGPASSCSRARQRWV